MMIRALDLKAPQVDLAWHEVVALVLEIAAAVRTRPGADLSDLSAILLTGDGQVEIVEGSTSAAPVRQLADLLDDLLESASAPQALQQIADRNRVDPPAEATLDAFEAVLQPFERPGRTEILARLAARAVSTEPDVDRTEALEHLVSRVREEEPAEQPVPARTYSQPRRERRWAGPVLAIATFTVSGAVCLLALAYFSAPARPEGAPPQPVVERIQAGVAHLVESATGPADAAAAPEPAPPAAPSSAPSTGRRAGARKPVSETPRPDMIVSLRSLGGHIAETGADDAEALPPAPDPAVYTSEDEDVTPALLMRPQLPSHPPANVALEEVGMLELTVTEIGTVEHVRLISPSNRFQERMLVSAAKAWRFRPATKDGRAVRFRARVQITL